MVKMMANNAPKKATTSTRPLCFRPSDRSLHYLKEIRFLDRHGRTVTGRDLTGVLNDALTFYLERGPLRTTGRPSALDLRASWQRAEIAKRKDAIQRLQREIVFLASPWPETWHRIPTATEIAQEAHNRREMEVEALVPDIEDLPSLLPG